MNKRHKKLQRQHKLFLFVCDGDSQEYDTYYGFTCIARNSDHAVELVLKSRLPEWEYNSQCPSQIKENIVDCLDAGLPIPKRWLPHVTNELLKESYNEPAKWTFRKMSAVPDIATPQLLATSYQAG